jgi:hypothetical protein
MPVIKDGISTVLEEIIEGLIKPLTEEEKSPKPKVVEEPTRITFKGNLEEVNQFFYRRGLSFGAPITPPTEEAVAEMLTGTDLPPDHLVAKIPPRYGKATVEKVAINAVMAGCLPTYMPVLIAIVQGMIGPEIRIEGYSCSIASWAPLAIVNGPIRKDIGINSGQSLFSPYYRANTAIGHAIGFITQNIGGVRPGIEDMAVIGHEGKFGMCIGENEEDSPWEPLHVERGLRKEDNAVTLFYPNCRTWLITNVLHGTRGPAARQLPLMCNNMASFGGDPGSAIIMMPGAAKQLADEGWTKKEVIGHLVEYTRRPLSVLPGRPKKKELMPLDSNWTRRIFNSADHVLIIVAGGPPDSGYVMALGGGGDYGGPAIRKIELPANWDKLVKKYKDIVPKYSLY